MRLTQPSLTVTFYLQTPETVTVTDSDLIRDSFTFSEQLLNGLSPSSNKVTFKLHKKAPVIEKIISYQVDALAVLSDGNTTLFTGYLSDNYSWKVNTSGESELEVTIEDVGTKLLGKAFLTSNSPSLYNLKGLIYSGSNSILSQICLRAGITMAASQPAITTQICANIDKNLTCKDLLGTMLLEAGYTYYFNNEGKLCLYKIDCSSVTGIPIIDKTGLYAVNKNAITLTKKVNQYKQVNVSYDEYETRSNALIYKDISKASGAPDNTDCYIILKPNEYYPVNLLDVSTVAAMQALTPSDTELGAYVRVTTTNKTYTVVTKGTAGADVQGTSFDFVLTPVSEISFVDATDIDEGKEIVYIENVVGTVTTTGSVSYTISKHGAKDLSVVLHNTGNNNAIVTTLQAKATITDVKAKCILIAGEGSGTASENVYSTATKYIHTKFYVQNYANMIADYYRYCNYSYQFYATVDYPVGTIVNVVDNLFSGLTVNILITARKYTDQSNIIQYSGVAISPFDLSADINSEQTLTPVIPSARGPEGESITTSFEYALTSSSSVTPSTWYPTRPDGWQSGYCYWYREKYEDESGNVTYSSATIDTAYNSMMEQLVVFEIRVNSYNYKRNLRTSNDQTITIKVKKDYVPGNCTITAETADAVSIPVTTVTANEEYTITINDANDYDKVIIYGAVSGMPTQTVILEVIDETEYNKNFGSVSALPTDVTLDGDYFFVETGFGDYQTGIPYVKENGSWTQLAGTNPENAQKLLGVMGTVLSDEQTPSSVSALYGWFQNLAAQSAVIQSLFSKAVTILDPGYIKSSNFAESDGFVTQGFKLNSSGLGQFGEGTQLGNVDIRINDNVSGTPVQLLSTSKYSVGDSYSITAKTRWKTNEVFNSNWSSVPIRYTDTSNGTYNGNSFYKVNHGYYAESFDFKPGETSNYVLTFDKACTVTLYFDGTSRDNGIFQGDLIIDGQNYTYSLGNQYPFNDYPYVTYTKYVSAGGSITVNTSNFTYAPGHSVGANKMGRCGIRINSDSYPLALVCNKRTKGYSDSSTQTLPAAGTYNFTIFPGNLYLQNSLSYTTSGGTTISSGSYLNYTTVSNFASIPEGNYTCTNSTINGNTITALTRSGSYVYFFTSGGTTIECNTSPDTSTFASDGWYNLSGSITLVGSQSSLITYNINASNANADIGAVQPYNNIHANNIYGTHRGHVNGTSSAAYSGNYKVWGAVFN